MGSLHKVLEVSSVSINLVSFGCVQMIARPLKVILMSLDFFGEWFHSDTLLGAHLSTDRTTTTVSWRNLNRELLAGLAGVRKGLECGWSIAFLDKRKGADGAMST